MEAQNGNEMFGDVIYAYTRAQAIEDGMLADLTETAKEAGINFPVAITEAAFTKCIEVPAGCEDLQDAKGREWDVLWMLKAAIQRGLASSSTILYTVRVVTSRGRSENVTLKAVCGPGDNMEPVITIMFPNED